MVKEKNPFSKRAFSRSLERIYQNGHAIGEAQPSGIDFIPPAEIELEHHPLSEELVRQAEGYNVSGINDYTLAHSLGNDYLDRNPHIKDALMKHGLDAITYITRHRQVKMKIALGIGAGLAVGFVSTAVYRHIRHKSK